MPDIDALEAAVNALFPVEAHNTPDYAELAFNGHQSQAMTMDSQTWLALNDLPTLITSYRAQLAAGGGEKENVACAITDRLGELTGVAISKSVADQIAEAALSSITPTTDAAKDDEIEWEARFLIDRLEELEFNDIDQVANDYFGHVSPSVIRLASLLSNGGGNG